MTAPTPNGWAPSDNGYYTPPGQSNPWQGGPQRDTRYADMSPDELRRHGVDSFGHPADGRRDGRAMRNGRGREINRLADQLGTLELLGTQDIEDFTEFLRKICTYLATTTQMAAGSLRASSKVTAENFALEEGRRLTVSERTKLRFMLRRLGKDLENVAGDFTDAATGAVKSAGRMQTFMTELQAARDEDNHRTHRGR